MVTTSISPGVYRIGALSGIPPGEGRAFRIDGMDIAVFRTRDDQVMATQATCPHLGGPLADGITGNGVVICPLHGFRFRLATGEPVGHECGGLETYAVSVDADGLIVLTIGG